MPLGLAKAVCVRVKGDEATLGRVRAQAFSPALRAHKQGMFLVLVTNKQSNILEDLDTLRLMSKVVPEYCGVRRRQDKATCTQPLPLTHPWVALQVVDEDSVCRNAFELIFAFDEVRAALGIPHRALCLLAVCLTPGPGLPVQVISLGHKENVTLPQVRTYTDMESHEEKLHKMIIQSKINDTKDIMKRKAMEIDKSKVEAKLAGATSGRGGMGNMRSGGFGGGGISSSTYFEDGERGGMGGAGPRGAPGMDAFTGGPSSSMPPPSISSGGALGKNETRVAAPSKGLVLGGKASGTKTSAFIESLRAEGDAVEAEPAGAPQPVFGGRGGPSGGAAVSGSFSGARPAPGSAESVVLTVEEKISCTLKKEGGLEALEVQGTLLLEVHNDEDAHCRVQVAPLSAESAKRGVQFKTHPNIDKALHAGQNVLALKDAGRPFPTGSALGILKWRCAPKEENAAPLQLNCWPSLSGDKSSVSIEYEAAGDMDLHQVTVTIPVPASREPPVVNMCDGQWRHDSRKHCLTWQIDLIDDQNRNGSMEFSVPASDPAAFFPIDVSFSSKGTYCGVAVDTVTRTSDGAPVKYTFLTHLATDKYVIQ